MKLAGTVKKIIVGALRPFPALRRVARSVSVAFRKYQYQSIAKRVDVEPDTIIFESFMGRGFNDNPKAIYEEMLSNKKYANCRFIWAFKENKKNIDSLQLPRAELVSVGSRAYYQAYARASVWVSNSRLPEQLQPKEDQRYIQTWHGTTLKKLGYDIAVRGKNAMNTKRELRKKYSVDAERYFALVSPSPYMTAIYQSSFNLQKHPQAQIWETGYPRNDRLVNATKSEIAELKKKLELPADKKIVLYAPTWRDDQHAVGVGYTYETELDFGLLREKLSDEYVILFRAHYFIANSFDFMKYDGFVRDVSRVDDINDLFLVADLLITDYSSVLFDYAILQRPVVLYMYDLMDYRNNMRGFYLDITQDLPGPITETSKDVVEAIKSATVDPQDFERFNQRFNPYEDGKSAMRAAERIWS